MNIAFQPGEHVQIIKNTTDPRYDWTIGKTAHILSVGPVYQYSEKHTVQRTYIIDVDGHCLGVLQEEISP